MLRKITLLVTLVLGASALMAQVGSGSMKGKLTDAQTGEPLPFVNIVLEKEGVQVNGAATDFDGNYNIKPLEPGRYTVKVSYVGYTPKAIEEVLVKANSIRFLNIELSPGVELDAVEVVKYKVPIIDPDNTASGETVDRKSIEKMAARGVDGLATTVAGVSTEGTGGGVSIRGSRTGGNFYYIDGVKVRGSNNLPKSAIENVQVITGGLPANYGDATGGVISVTTRGPSREYFGSVEVLSSGIKTGDDIVGLDNFGSNTVDAVIAGPILWKKDENGEKDQPLMGFILSGNYTRFEEGRISAIGYNTATDQTLGNLLANPLSRSNNGTGDGVVYNSELTRASNYMHENISRNTAGNRFSFNGKLSFTLNPTMNLSVGGRMVYLNRRDFNFANTLMNYDQNPERTSLDYSFNARFSQRFANDEESSGSVRNVFYSVQFDYSKQLEEVGSHIHGQDYFKYGYVGRFDLYKETPFEPVQDRFGNTTHISQSDIPGDTLIVYTPGDVNPLLANYTSDYFTLFDETEGNYDKLDNIIDKGLRNGDAPRSLYGLWNNIGTPTGSYVEQDNTQVRVSASGNADIGDHAISLGFEYEQRVDRQFFARRLSGSAATNIWAIARNNTNSHLKNLDRSDSTQIGSQGTLPIYAFPILIDSENQSSFDRNLRSSLGLDPDGDDFINIDALDPSQLSLDFFSPDELLNNGQFLTGYYGYDPYGNKINSNPSIQDYFTQTDENGNLTRLIPAFQPIYFAGYVMDKFSFDDLIFNVGVRVDRFDANQPVLKDRFLFAEANTVGELLAGADQTLNGQLLESLGGDVPGGISDDAVVYVDNATDPNAITGFREGSTFFDASGQVADADAIVGSSGEVQPYLKNNAGNDLEAGAFEDYKPQVNVMPRISFSFPISDEALFFAHYDILTIRPTSNARMDIVRYQFIRNLGSGQGSPINNPNLKPEKTIDYELGFQQKLTNSSGLKISAYYREMRDMIQVFQNVGAYPQDYYSFENLDFGTVKGLSVGYDLRRTGNVTMRINYTLQFAEGTGSSAGGSVVNLNNTEFSTLRTIFPFNYDQRHRINAMIDYHYGEGKGYNGPMWGETPILANAGANFTFNLGSGTPYSASTDPKNRRLDGTINGSRLPWRFTIDAQFDKTFKLRSASEEGEKKKKQLDLNVFLLVNNLLDAQNILGVYPFSGNADDDGYLNDPRYQAEIAARRDEQAFRDLYALNNLNPGNYALPRRVRIGVRFGF